MVKQNDVVASLPTEGYVRLPQILAVIPVSKSSWWAGVKAGRYPQRVKLGPRTTAWKVAEIRALIANAEYHSAKPDRLNRGFVSPLFAANLTLFIVIVLLILAGVLIGGRPNV